MIVSQALNEARLGAVVSFLGSGAYLVIYDATDAALVTVPLPNPVGAVAGNTLTLAGSDESMIASSGVAETAALFNSNGVLAISGIAVTDMSGAGPLKLSSTTMFAGGYTRLVSGAIG